MKMFLHEILNMRTLQHETFQMYSNRPIHVPVRLNWVDVEKEDGTRKGYKWCVWRVKHIVVNQSNSWDGDGQEKKRHEGTSNNVHDGVYTEVDAAEAYWGAPHEGYG